MHHNGRWQVEEGGDETAGGESATVPTGLPKSNKIIHGAALDGRGHVQADVL